MSVLKALVKEVELVFGMALMLFNSEMGQDHRIWEAAPCLKVFEVYFKEVFEADFGHWWMVATGIWFELLLMALSDRN